MSLRTVLPLQQQQQGQQKSMSLAWEQFFNSWLLPSVVCGPIPLTVDQKIEIEMYVAELSNQAITMTGPPYSWPWRFEGNTTRSNSV